MHSMSTKGQSAIGRSTSGVDLWAMAKRMVGTVSVEDVVAAVETARDKVMSDEVKSLVKLGLPKAVAYKMVAERYRQKTDDESGEGDAGTPWPDMS